MGRFSWAGSNAEGAVLRGNRSAADSRDLANELRREGYSVMWIRRRKWPPTNFHIERLSRRDMINFTYKLVPLLASSLSLKRILDLLREQVKKYRVKNALALMKQDVSNGASLSEAMGRHPDVFPRPYVSAVRAGEHGGDLVRALSMMGSFLEWLDDVIKQIWAVLSYPLLVAAALIVLSCVLAFFAIPTFLDLYSQLGLEIEIPLPTRMVFAFSRILNAYWYVLVALVGAGIVVFMLRKVWPGLRLCLHRVCLRIPYLGDITRRLQSLQFCRYFQMLHQNGVPVKVALAEAQGVLTNLVMAQAVDSVSHRLEEGVSLSDAFDQTGQFPSLVAEQIRVGEESGDIGQSLQYLVRYYDAELDYSIKRFIVFLRPALVAVLALVVLILALSFYLPLFEIVNLID